MSRSLGWPFEEPLPFGESNDLVFGGSTENEFDPSFFGKLKATKSNRMEDPVIPPDKHRMAGKGKIENLRPPWKPGESGNPSGRPRRRSISDSYAEFAEMPVPNEIRRRLKLKIKEGTTFADAVVTALYVAAINGNVGAIRELRESIEGKGDERPKVTQNVNFRIIEETAENKNLDELTSKTKTPEES